MINEKEKISVSHQCALLDIDRSYLYYQPTIQFDDTEVINRILELYAERPAYGYRKICVLLREEGFLITKKKVHKLMKILNIRSMAPGPNTSEPSKDNHGHPYLLKALCICRPNQVWAVDITYIKLPTGMVYLFALIDWHSRCIVGWTLATTMCAEHAVAVLRKAIAQYGIPDICNMDQGSQFTGAEWITELKLYGIRMSHDGVGRYLDNIRIERFWRTIKYEDINIKHYQNVVDLRKGIAAFIEYYNNERPHQALQYKRPSGVYFSNDTFYIEAA